jgi:putative ABC transport system permease protein
VRVSKIDGRWEEYRVAGDSFAPETADLDSAQRAVDQLVATLDDATVTSLDVALDPAAEPLPELGIPPITLAVPFEDHWNDVSLLYVATPELVDNYGVDLDNVDPETEFLTVETGDLWILGDLDASRDRSNLETITNVERLPAGYSSLPGSFIAEAHLRERGWDVVPSGQWLVETPQALTSEQIATARDLAAAAGLAIEARDTQAGLTALRSGATAVGMFLALGILAMTVGLIRGEAAGDVRTLAASGATSGTRRTLTAATAGGLALLGVILGTAGAYLALSAGFIDDLGDLGAVPVRNLAAIVLGTPLAAAAAGWLLAGRPPTMIGRQPIE